VERSRQSTCVKAQRATECDAYSLRLHHCRRHRVFIAEHCRFATTRREPRGLDSAPASTGPWPHESVTREDDGAPEPECVPYSTRGLLKGTSRPGDADVSEQTAPLFEYANPFLQFF
jgi:hypothetical protein